MFRNNWELFIYLSIYLKNSLCIETCFLAIAKPWLLLGFASPGLYHATCLPFSSVFIVSHTSADQLERSCSPPIPIIFQGQLTFQTPTRGSPLPWDLSLHMLSHIILWFTPAFLPLWPHFSLSLPYHSSFDLVHRAVGLYWPVISLKVVNIHLWLLSPAQYLTHSRCSISCCWIN